MSASDTIVTSAAGSYLTFHLGGEEYGVPITTVREIIGTLPVTPVPASPPEMEGVINLRGKVIPVLSMRRRFGMPPAEPDPHNVILVVEGGADGVVGLSVDRVNEVVAFAAADVEPPPNQGGHGAASSVLAIGKSQGRIRILLDVIKVIGN